MESPKTPSHTEKTKNTTNIYILYSNITKYIIIKKKILNTINSNLNKTINKCLCLETKIILPNKNIKKITNIIFIIICFYSLKKTLVL